MIDEREVAVLLHAGADDIAVRTPPARALAAAGIRRRRRRRLGAGVGAVAAVAAVAVATAVVGPDRTSRTTGPADPTATTGATCVDPVPSRVLPPWARTGFPGASPRAPHVLGEDGLIAAVLFVQPLTSPPSDERANKVLWVSPYDDGSPLLITATSADGSVSATRVVDGGPGPSVVDLPGTGCWRLTLEWAGRTDTLDLAYRSP